MGSTKYLLVAFFDHRGQKLSSTLLRYIFRLAVAVLLVLVTDTHNTTAKRHPEGTRFILYLKRVFSQDKKVPNLCRPDQEMPKRQLGNVFRTRFVQ